MPRGKPKASNPELYRNLNPRQKVERAEARRAVLIDRARDKQAARLAQRSITPPNPETIFSDKVTLPRTEADILVQGIAQLRVSQIPDEIDSRAFYDAWRLLKSRLKF